MNQELIPKVVTAPTGTWVAEGSPSGMVVPVFGGVVIGPPRKLLFGAACTSELKDYSAAVANEIIQRTISDAAVTALDTALLDNVAADTTRPAGLLNGLSTLGATSGGGAAALAGDLGKFGAAFYTAKISVEDLLLVMNPAQALTARALLPLSRLTIVPSNAVADKVVIALAPTAIAMYAALPQMEVRDDTVVHMDTAPSDIVSSGSPASGSVKSTWQTSSFAIRVRLRATWAPLATGAAQFISAVTW